MMDGQNKLLATVDNIQSQMSEIGDLHHKSQRIHLVLIAFILMMQLLLGIMLARYYL